MYVDVNDQQLRKRGESNQVNKELGKYSTKMLEENFWDYLLQDWDSI